MRISVDRWQDRIGAWLLPARCVLCEAPGQPPGLDLCAACQCDLPVHVGPCPRCALPVRPDPPFSECPDCRADPPPWDRCHAPYSYGFPLDDLVHELKYEGHLAVARVLGTLLGRSAARRDLHAGIDALLPVPLHPEKLVERGFNQSIEIARWAAREVGRPVAEAVLRRVRPTRPQVGLALDQRRANLQGAFAAAAGVRGARVAVIDDVMTTGSTVREIAWSLRRAGADGVDIWCVARTPR